MSSVSVKGASADPTTGADWVPKYTLPGGNLVKTRALISSTDRLSVTIIVPDVMDEGIMTVPAVIGGTLDIEVIDGIV